MAFLAVLLLIILLIAGTIASYVTITVGWYLFFAKALPYVQGHGDMKYIIWLTIGAVIIGIFDVCEDDDD